MSRKGRQKPCVWGGKQCLGFQFINKAGEALNTSHQVLLICSTP